MWSILFLVKQNQSWTCISLSHSESGSSPENKINLDCLKFVYNNMLSVCFANSLFLTRRNVKKAFAIQFQHVVEPYNYNCR